VGKHTIIFTLLVLMMAINSAIGQDKPASSVEKKQRDRQWDIFLNFSDRGTGAGLKLFYDLENKDSKLGFGFMIAGVRGKGEYIYYDPYNYYYPYRKVGSKFFTMIIPFTVSLKKPVFREDITSDFRPFIIGETGPVYGIAFPKGNGFFKNIRLGKGQLTLGAFVGFGIEFGNEQERVYGVTLGFHYMWFPEYLGERQDYPGFDIRFNFISN